MNSCIVIHAAGDLRIETLEEKGPGPGEVAIRVERGGICGSDLHYYHHGGFGAVRLREPMILGHEVAGVVSETGSGVSGLKPGDRVAVSPSRPCGCCRFCREHLYNHCLDMRFYGSAMPMPHIQGAFRTVLIADESQCHAIGPDIDIEQAAFAEPFAVGLHATSRAGPLGGKSVLVCGAGPIGVLTALACTSKGAQKVTITDIQDAPLERAKAAGIENTINVTDGPDCMADWARDKGHFDVVIEASGSPSAMMTALNVVRPRGRIVQLGLGGEVPLPLTALVAREAELVGSFRFHEEFGEAVDLINARKIDFAPLLTGIFPVAEATNAFEAAGDRSTHMKVQIAFST